MKSLMVAICGIVLIVLACGPSTASSSPVGSGAIPTNLASAAHDQLCNDADPGSLSKIASALDEVDTDTDTSDIEARLGALLVGLQQLQVDATTQPVRDAAGTAVLQLQTSIKDPKTRADAVKRAADALRAVDAAVCK